MPDVAKAKLAAQRIYTLLHTPTNLAGVPTITAGDGAGAAASSSSTASIQGRVELEDVTFTYPARPDAQVLKGLSLLVEPGKTLALVGSSGCGKSTVIALLERYYDPTGGRILIDGKPMEGMFCVLGV